MYAQLDNVDDDDKVHCTDYTHFELVLNLYTL